MDLIGIFLITYILSRSIPRVNSFPENNFIFSIFGQSVPLFPIIINYGKLPRFPQVADCLSRNFFRFINIDDLASRNVTKFSKKS